MIFEPMDRIVFAGDSVTDMGSAQPVGEGLFDNVGQSYVRIIENMLSTWYPEVYLRVTNSGVSGNTSRDLLQRFDSDVVSLNPDWVSICIGINDVWRQFDSPAIPDGQVMPEEYEANLEKMILSVKGKRMDEYGAICKKLAAKHGCCLVDLQEVFNRYFEYRHSSYIAWDRVHPNLIGATVIAKAVLSHCGFEYDHQPAKKETQTC